MYLQSLMKFHHCLFKILRKIQKVVDKELQRAITLTELAPSPYFSIINVQLVDIMCLPNLMKFHHCLFKLLRKNQNVADYEIQRAITLKEWAPSPYISTVNGHLVDINVFAKFYKIPSLPFQDTEKKRCGWTDGLMNRRTT